MRDLVAPALMLASVVNLAVQVEFLRNEVFALSEILARVEVQVEGRGEAIGTISEDVASIRADIASIRADIASIRADIASIRADIASLIAKLDDIDTRLSTMNDRASRRGLFQELHRQLAIRFDESGEGAAYGGPRLAVDRLMLRAKPEADAALADILKVPRSAPPMLLAQDLSNDLWARRMQFLNF